jgi:hypothetical protein
VTIDEFEDIKRRWESLVGDSLSHYKANPQDLSERGRFMVIDVPKLLDASNVELRGCALLRSPA